MRASQLKQLARKPFDRPDLDHLCRSRLMLAPMVGITHFVVRKAISEYLPEGVSALWPTEMLSSRRIPHQKVNSQPELYFYDYESNLGPQLLGNDENCIRDSIEKLEDWGAVSIDINMGCPVQKALKHNYGVALMGDSDYAASVTAMAVRATRLPVSVKLRAGLQKDAEYLLKFTKGIENSGASWITLHPRTAEEKRRGAADWKQIAFVKSELSIPVVGNGDIQCLDDILRMQSETGCDRVMAGRVLTAKPWLMREANLSNPARLSPEDQAAEYGRFLLRIIDLSEEFYLLTDGLKRIRFLVYHGHGWLEFGHFLWSQLRAAESYEACRQVVKKFFEAPKRMFERTELRH